MASAKDIREQALAMSVSERASLAHDLILSLDDPAEYELSPAQEAEIERRLAAVREGIATGRPAEEVFADIRARFA